MSSFFTIIGAITLGDDLVQQWLTSLVMSFLTGVFLTQPIQVALTTFFFVAIFRSPKEDELATREINRGVKKRQQLKRRDSNGEDVLVYEKDEPLVDIELDEMRQKRLKDLKVERFLKKIVWHALFSWLIYIVIYANQDTQAAFVYQSKLKANLINYKFNLNTSTTFDDVKINII